MTSAGTYRQICITAPADGFTGPVVAGWIERIVDPIRLGWVALTDVDLASDPPPTVSVGARELLVLPYATLLDRLGRAVQVVWASMFFCQGESDAQSISADETYQDSTRKAGIVVRVVDATYIYVIGPLQSLRPLEGVFPSAHTQDGAVDDLDFPE